MTTVATRATLTGAETLQALSQWRDLQEHSAEVSMAVILGRSPLSCSQTDKIRAVRRDAHAQNDVLA
jgi:hypothetical protein